MERHQVWNRPGIGEVLLALLQISSAVTGGAAVGLWIEPAVMPLEPGSGADNIAKVIFAIVGSGSATLVSNFIRPFNISVFHRTLITHSNGN